MKGSVPIPDGSDGSHCAPLPLFLEAQTPSPVPPWRDPVPACNIATYLHVLGFLPTTGVCQDTRCISQSPWPGLPASSGTCSGLRPLWRLKGIPEAVSCWSQIHIKTLSSLSNPVQLAFLCPHASQDALAAAGPEHPCPRLGCDKHQ